MRCGGMDYLTFMMRLALGKPVKTLRCSLVRGVTVLTLTQLAEQVVDSVQRRCCSEG